MKTIRDDTEFLEAERINNELAAKKAAIDSEIAKIQAALDNRSNHGSSDVVSNALELEPGVCAHGGSMDVLATRQVTLRGQSDQVRRALLSHAQTIERARRDGGYRVLARTSNTYQKQARALLGLVDQLIAANGLLADELKVLYGRGCTDAPEVQFPQFGLAQQLPEWRKGLVEQIARLDLIVATYSAAPVQPDKA